MTLPDDYYEIKFIKLSAAALLPYGQFIKYIDGLVALIDNWALCDSFRPACIKSNRKSFLPYVEKYLLSKGEFYERFALTTLLAFCVEEEYLGYIFSCIERADCSYYYVKTAAAWLIAEVLAKHFEEGVRFLKRGTLDGGVRSLAVQKATESLRISREQKSYLKALAASMKK